jgi:hypothetical protein
VSTQVIWEDVIELAKQARKEALGAPVGVNVHNTNLIRKKLHEIEQQCGATEKEADLW